MDQIRAILGNLFPLFLLVLGYVIGRQRELSHLKSLRQREAATEGILVSPVARLPGIVMSEPSLVTGEVVISIDYFKRFAAKLRGLFGGQMMSLETVVDRGRREAVLRMKERAISKGKNAVVGMRIETSRLANARGNGKGTAGIEMVAYGTGVRLPEAGDNVAPGIA